MLELLKKGFYAVIGGAVLSGKKLQALKESALKSAAESEKEGRAFVRKIAEPCGQGPGRMTGTEERVEETLKRLDVPIRKEFTELELRIRKLENPNRTSSSA